jgi:hypothetical protein
LLTLERPKVVLADLLKHQKTPSLPQNVTSDTRLEPFVQLYHQCTSFNPQQRPSAASMLQKLKAIPSNSRDYCSPTQTKKTETKQQAAIEHISEEKRMKCVIESETTHGE